MNATVITPYVFQEEITALKNHFWNIPTMFEQDVARIGSDMMFQKMWKTLEGDIIIIHADMQPLPEDVDNNWYTELCSYAEKYPEAGMIGCKLLYPAKSETGRFIIQHAGGNFDDKGNAGHFGSGLRMEDQSFFKQVEVDEGQYDKVREVAWCTFGGIYIRREVLNQVGDFDPSYEYTYERDVDYCLEARKLGWKIYMVPTTLIHWESKDNKRVMTENLYQAQMRNKERLKKKWAGSDLFKTLDKVVE